MRNKKIVVIGTGYVGLPVAVMLADAGFEVMGIDINKNIVETINKGEMHINEEELKVLMRKKNVRKNLKAQSKPCKADVFIIAVPTPLDKRKKVADLSYVKDAMDSILPCLEKGNLIIVESTVPPLTCRELIKPMVESRALCVGDDILIAHCPERILPGKIFYEIVHNDRIIGGINEESSIAARQVYSSFVKGNLYITDDVTAEICKLMENTYRDVNIALANEFSAVAGTLGIDIKMAIELANKHPRVNILQPSIGVGGHCIPIDPWFIKEVDPSNCSLIFAARNINDQMPAKTAAKIRKAVKRVPNPRIVAVGATYKANTYDLRESPALEVVSILKEDGYKVELYDPLTKEYPCTTIEKIVRGADCLVILVEHDSVMKEIAKKRSKIERLMRTPIIMCF